MRHWDIAGGITGTLATVTLSNVNEWLACAAGVLTVIMLSLRVRSEWINRNRKPKD